MRIVHIAVWTRDLETMRVFYERYFGGRSGEKYVNRAKGFESYMVRLGDTALELMRSARIADRAEQDERIGFCHIAVSTGSAKQVRDLTERLRQDGYAVLGEPRTTGDGYYESVVADPEGNRVEITI
ncbi:VOC family protein [Alistipes ihumii]